MSEITIKQTEPQTVAFIGMQGPYALMPEGYGRLYGWIAQHGLQPVGMPAAVYFTSPAEVPESEALWELQAPIAEAAESEPDENGIGIKRVPAMTVASVMYTGPYEAMSGLYEELGAWIAKEGYQVAGPPCEIYYSDPNEVPPEQYVTEVVFPVMKA